MKENLVISLENVRLYGHHGVAAQERTVGAEFAITLRVEMPRPQGCFNDELADTVSYADIYEVVKDEFARPSRLIEHVATRICTRVLETFDCVQSAEIKLVKVSPPIPGYCGSASVSLFLKKNRS